MYNMSQEINLQRIMCPLDFMCGQSFLLDAINCSHQTRKIAWLFSHTGHITALLEESVRSVNHFIVCTRQKDYICSLRCCRGDYCYGHTAVVCLMLWKLILVGDVGMDMARATRTRRAWLSCQRCHRFLTAERT